MQRLWTALTLAGTLAVAPALAADIDPDRREDLMEIVDNTCVTCHGVHLVGGVGPALTPDALAGRDTGELADTIVNGSPGTPMPAFTGMIDGREARWLVERLKEGL